ncbi:MAG: hypothetical protein RJA70_1517 [Pseudomonadota bacterium]
MASQSDVYVTGLAYRLGRDLPIEQVLAGRVSPDLLDRLHGVGFRRCAVSSVSALQLAKDAAAAALEAGALHPSSVGAVVYATCSFWDEQVGQLSAARVRSEVLAPLGLGRVELWGVGLAESGNLASALRVARNLLRVDATGAVLVVTTDKVPARECEYRAMPNAVAVNSDAAAACIVTSEAGHGFVLEDVAQVSSPRMTSHAKGNGFAKHLEVIAGVRGSVGAVLQRLGLSPSNFRWLITNNYGIPTLDGFANAVGFERERLYLSNVPRFAHAFSADNLINLADAVAEGRLSAAERVLTLSTGPLTWGAASLRRC